MSLDNSDGYTYRNADISDLVSEENKLKDPYLRGNVDHAIQSLVRPNAEIQTAYDFYNGIRDEREYKYLEQNYGLGSGTKLMFIPLVRKHVQALLGQHLASPLNHRVTCSDSRTLDLIRQQKVSGQIRQVMRQVAALLQQSQAQLQAEQVANPQAIPDPLAFNKALETISREYNNDWKSEFEINAQTVADYLIQSQSLKLQFNQLLETMLICGVPCYKVTIHAVGRDPELEILNPKHLFVERTSDTRFFRDCPRAVYRRTMTRQSVLNRYGHELSEDDRLTLMGHPRGSFTAMRQTGYTIDNAVGFDERMQARWAQGVSPQDEIEVCHVEWLANNKVEESEEEFPEEVLEKHKDKKVKYRYRLDRYEGIRIGQNIYVGMGKSKHVVRPADNPWLCTLTYNGLFYSDRNGKPYSLLLQTKDLQDKYDILHFHLENMVARSGGKGVDIPLSTVPQSFGNGIDERVAKHLAYIKNGARIIDDTQEGMNGAQAKQYNNFGQEYNLSLDGRAVKAIMDTLAFLEETASSITGVNRQALGQVANSDQVGTTNIAMTQYALITKPYFSLSAELMRMALTDLVNAARITYKKGKKGALVLGQAGQRIFTIDPDKFCLSDYNVFLSDSGEELDQIETIKALTMELVKNQMVDVNTALDMTTMRSLSQIKKEVREGLKRQEESIVMQLQQKVKELEEALKQAQAGASGASEAELQLKAKEVDAKARHLLGDLEIKEKARLDKKEYDQVMIELEAERVKLERDQLLYSPQAMEPKNKD